MQKGFIERDIHGVLQRLDGGGQGAVKARLRHRHIAERRGKVHVPLRLAQPLEKRHAGLLPLRRGSDHAQPRAPLHDQLLPAGKDGAGQREDLHLLGPVVLIGHHVGIIQHAGRGGHGGDHVAGAQRLGGVAAAQPQPAGQRGSGVRRPGIGELGAEGEAVLVEKALSQRLHPHLKIVEVIVVGEEALAARPVRVLLRHGVQPLPGGQLVQACAGLGGEAVKGRLVHKEDLRGFGQRQNDQPVMDRPLRKKFREVARQVFLGEIVPVVHQDAFIRQRQHGFGVGHEQVRQRRCARLLVGGGQHALVDAAGVADAVYPHPDALRLPHGAVELVDQRVHGGADLAAVNVPKGEGDGLLLLLFPASGEAQHKAGGQRQCRQPSDRFLHGYASSLGGTGAAAGPPRRFVLWYAMMRLPGDASNRHFMLR